MDRYTQKNGPRVCQLQKAISVVAQENSSISCYFTKIKTLCEELNNYIPISICSCCHCGRMKSILELYSQERVLQFLMGLNDSFSAIRARILLMDHLPSINKVFSLIIQEEKEKEICVNLISHDTSLVMMTKSFLPKHSPSTHHEPAVYMSKPHQDLNFSNNPTRKAAPCVLIVESLVILSKNAIKCMDSHLVLSLLKTDQYHIQQPSANTRK
jgi:hypothetical protein